MAEIGKKSNEEISKQNISYYDEIASNYDAILNKDAANKIIRTKVADKFIGLAKGRTVLDLGGGTGQDLGWMVAQNYYIIFCEPSVAMRQIAIERCKKEFPSANISFFDNDKTDLKNWNETFPFQQKVDAVLANFAVINCMLDIELLFEKLALATNPGAVIILLILDNSLKKRSRSNFKDTLRSFFSQKPVCISINYNDQQQLVYLHLTKAIKKASKDNFIFNDVERLNGLGFSVIHLIRK